MKNKKFRNLIVCIIGALIVAVTSFLFGKHLQKEDCITEIESNTAVAHIGERTIMKTFNKWNRCLLTSDGTIYLKDSIKSLDGGKTFIPHQEIDIEDSIAQPERAALSKGNLFFAMNGPTEIREPGIYEVKTWRSEDGLKTIREEKAIINVPEGPKRHFENDQWNGLFVYRTIIEMPDGSWLATMYGNFAADTLAPQGNDAARECKFMMRTFIVTSTDQGHTWNYLSTVATPHSGEPVGEGFVEPAITLLNDGRLLCALRTGHHFPLYLSWSSDGGKTWSPPLYSGFDRGCDPCLITLRDGRVALSWGRRFPEGWSQITEKGDKGNFKYPGEGYTNLSISEDSGETWTTTKIDKNTGSCYSTIFEVEPNVIFCQVDRWCWRITLKPLNNKA